MADLTVTAANVVQGTGAQVELGTAGATVTAGQPVYKDTADANKLKPCDADVQATAKAAGIALHAATAGQPLLYQTGGQLTPGATMSPGEHYFVSTTAGGLCPRADLATGDFPTRVIQAISASLAIVDINVIDAALP